MEQEKLNSAKFQLSLNKERFDRALKSSEVEAKAIGQAVKEQ